MILSTGHSNFPSTITEAQGLGLLEILSPIQSEAKQKFKQFLFGCLFVLCFNSSYKENKKTITELYRAVHLTFRFYRNESSQLSVTLTIRSVPILLRLLASEASVFITQLCCFGHVRHGGDRWWESPAHGQEAEDRKRKGLGRAKYILNYVIFRQSLGFV